MYTNYYLVSLFVADDDVRPQANTIRFYHYYDYGVLFIYFYCYFNYRIATCVPTADQWAVLFTY